MPIIGLEDDLHALALVALEDAATQLLEDLKDAAPYDTGELVESAYGPDIDEGALTATIGFDAPQADYTDLGTPPHVIEPVNATSLVFFWERGPRGPDVYAFQHVDHPGITGSSWFSDLTTDESWDAYLDDAVAAQ